MILAELMRNRGKRLGNRMPKASLSIRDDPRDGDRDQRLHLSKQCDQFLFSFAEQAAREQHFTREAIAEDPQDFMAHIGFQPIDPQDDLSLWEEAVPQRLCIREPE